MKLSAHSQIVFACLTKACIPPPSGGTGGSNPNGGKSPGSTVRGGYVHVNGKKMGSAVKKMTSGAHKGMYTTRVNGVVYASKKKGDLADEVANGLNKGRGQSTTDADFKGKSAVSEKKAPAKSSEEKAPVPAKAKGGSTDKPVSMTSVDDMEKNLDVSIHARFDASKGVKGKKLREREDYEDEDGNYWDEQRYTEMAKSSDPVTRAVGKYVMDSRDGTPMYVQVNTALRNGKAANAEVKSVIDGLDAAIESSTPLPRPIKTYRSVGDDGVPKDAKVGDVLTDQGFISTGVSSSAVEVNFGGRGVTMDITVPAGTKGVVGSIAEREFILPRGTSMRITEISVDRRGQRTMKMEVVS